MKFEELIHPMPVLEFSKRVKRGETFSIQSSKERLGNLLSLQDVERAINDGCNLQMPPYVIIDGERKKFIEKNLSWCTSGLKKAEILKLLQDGHSFMMPNMSQITPQVSQLISGIEQAIPGVDCDVHLYVSPKPQATGFDAHRDIPQHKIYIQFIGQTQWKIYQHSPSLDKNVRALTESQEAEHLSLLQEITLQEGDLLYMPPNVFS